jgi:hypothetical protein
MNYSKPEITVLGEATYVIQGSKVTPNPDTPIDLPTQLSFELED